MKILVISDTHGHLSNVYKVLKRDKHIKRIIHLGDMEKDAEELEYTTSYLVDYVAGNCDFLSFNPKEKIINISNVRIWITHGHNYSVKWSYNSFEKVAKQKEVEVALFGHTHIPYLEHMDGLTIMNPGSISKPREGNRPSYGMIEIDKKGLPHFTIGYV